MGTLWSVLYFYCNWQLSAKKNKKTTTREWEGMGVILPGVERDFPPVFSWDWDGKRLKFVMHFGNRRWAPGLMRHLAWETRSQRLTFSHYLASTHILNAFGRIQMSYFNLDSFQDYSEINLDKKKWSMPTTNIYIYIYTKQNYKRNTFVFAPIFHELNSKI